MSLSERTAIIAEIDAIYARTGIAPSRLVSFLGIPQSTWNNWISRRKAETRHNHDTPKSNWMTPEEARAIVDFCKQYKDRLHGYRYLAWLMVDREYRIRPSIDGLQHTEEEQPFRQMGFSCGSAEKGVRPADTSE